MPNDNAVLFHFPTWCLI